MLASRDIFYCSHALPFMFNLCHQWCVVKLDTAFGKFFYFYTREMNRLFTYNPFELLTAAFIEMLQQHAHYYVVLQRFQYPGIAENKGFMATAYLTVEEALSHLAELHKGEGKVLDLADKVEREKLLSLLEPSSGYQFFYSTTPDVAACKKLTQTYKLKVSSYIKSQLRMKGDGGYDVTLKVIAGRFMAVITSGQQRKEVLFYEMIR